MKKATEKGHLTLVFLIDSKQSNIFTKASLCWLFFYPIISFAFSKALFMPLGAEPPAVAKNA